LSRFRKTISVEAEVMSGRLLQRRHPETRNTRSPKWTPVHVASLAARMTTTGDGDGWKRRRSGPSGCSRKDTVAPGRIWVGDLRGSKQRCVWCGLSWLPADRLSRQELNADVNFNAYYSSFNSCRFVMFRSTWHSYVVNFICAVAH